MEDKKRADEMSEADFIRQKPVLLDFIAHRLDVINNRQLMAEYDVTHSQAKLLVRISHSPGHRIPQSELKAFGRRGSTITSVLAHLEKNGLISRSASDVDARAKYVELTPHGLDVALAERKIISELGELIDHTLTKKETESLQILLEKIAKALDDKKTNERTDNT